MEQKFISVNGLNLAYIEKNPGASETIFFIHGNSGSARVWRPQFASELLEGFRMIAFDLPGHGKSAVSDNPMNDYSPIGTSKILSAAIKELAKDNHYVIVGFSYGSNVIAEMLLNAISPAGMIFLGACVLGENYGMEKIFAPTNVPSILTYNETNRAAVTDFLRNSIHSVNTEDVQNSIEDYLSVSPDFKPALFQAAAEGKISDEILVLHNQNVPVCLIFGEGDNIVQIDYLDPKPFQLWRNQVFKFPDAALDQH